MKKKLFLIIFTLIFGGLIYFFKGNLLGDQGKGMHHKMPSVSVVELNSQNIKISKNLSGRTVAYQVAEVRPQVTGIITKKLFEGGSYVAEGQQLYQIDPSSYKASYVSSLAKLSEAVANKKTAKAKKDRFDKLSKKKTFISKSQREDADLKYEQAVAEVRLASAEAEKAKISLEYTKVNAPVSGYIGKSSVTKGALVTANQKEVLATITNLDPIYVDATLSSKEFSTLKNNMGDLKSLPVKLIYNDDLIYPYGGKILFHEVNVDKSTSSVSIRAVFPNQKKLLFPGMFVHMVLEEEYNDVFLVPQSATWRDEKGELLVWEVDNDNIVSSTILNVRQAEGKNWLVKDLSEKTKIVTENLMHLKPGTKVNIVTKGE